MPVLGDFQGLSCVLWHSSMSTQGSHTVCGHNALAINVTPHWKELSVQCMYTLKEYKSFIELMRVQPDID
jgi:hypothetical protein